MKRESASIVHVQVMGVLGGSLKALMNGAWREPPAAAVRLVGRAGV